ncbi:MAG: sulfatase-like hydrolase/transferase, partial [Opitutaceae bacterium]
SMAAASATALATPAMLAAALATRPTPAIVRGARRRGGDKPNLLFLWTDEQRADTFAVNGNRTYRMPALNALAAESVSFSRCYDTQPVCTPARSSVMTGLWPHTTGLTTNNISLPAATPTLPELLADSAYRTAYMGKWHLGDEVFAQHGFETWVSIEDIYSANFASGRGQEARSSYHHFLTSLGYKPSGHDGRFPRSFASRLPVEHTKPMFLAAEASKYLMAHRNEPWMLYVNFLEPHPPFSGPYDDLHRDAEAPPSANYPGQPIEREPEAYRQKREKFQRDGFEGHDLKSAAGWQHIARNYAGLCAQVDQALARILYALEISGQAENTITVFTSDHGEMLGAHSLLTKGVHYEESVRVPMLLRAPFRKQKPQRIEQPVSHIDLVPTLLDLMGRKPIGSLPGQSWMPLVAGGAVREDHVYIEWDSPYSRVVVSPDGWKLALFENDNCLLFDRSKDPLEEHNLYYRRESAPVIRRLRAKLERWQQTVGDRTVPTG